MNTWTSETRKEIMVAIGLVALAVVYRILPHPYNFAPVAGMAIFGGACFKNRLVATTAPLLALFLSDAVIGFHSTWISVYFSFALIAFVSSFINRSMSWTRLFGTSVGSSLFFFFATNFEVWLNSNFYSKTFAGLMESYAMGLPFLQRTLLGDLFFTAVLFGSYAVATSRISKVTV